MLDEDKLTRIVNLSNTELADIIVEKVLGGYLVRERHPCGIMADGWRVGQGVSKIYWRDLFNPWEDAMLLIMVFQRLLWNYPQVELKCEHVNLPIAMLGFMPQRDLQITVVCGGIKLEGPFYLTLLRVAAYLFSYDLPQPEVVGFA